MADLSTRENILGCASTHFLNKSLFHSAFYRFPNRLGEKRPVTRNFVQESYTHVKTQFGVDLLRSWTRKMQINGIVEMSYLV